jgi:protein BCP1
MAKGSKRKLAEEETLEVEDVAGTSEDVEGEQDDDSGDDETSNSEASSDSGDDSEGSEEDDEGDGDTVEVDLEFYDPSEKDFHGLKALLRTYLDDTDFRGCSELVDLIIQQVLLHCMQAGAACPCAWLTLSTAAQRTVGTVVKTAENDDPIGVLTALSLARHGGAGCMREIRQFLLKRCKDADLAAKLQEVM